MTGRDDTATGELRAEEITAGNWGVFNEAGQLVQDGFATSAAAWRYCDRKRTRPTWKNSDRAWWGNVSKGGQNAKSF